MGLCASFQQYCEITVLLHFSPGCGAFYDAGVANQVRSFQNGRLRHTNTDDLRERYTELHRDKAKKESVKSEVSSSNITPYKVYDVIQSHSVVPILDILFCNESMCRGKSSP